MKFNIDRFQSGPIRKFECPELPLFTIITGKSGSGKTKLLELIASGKVTVLEGDDAILAPSIQLNSLEIVVDSTPQNLYSGVMGFAHQGIFSGMGEFFGNVYRYVVSKEGLPITPRDEKPSYLDDGHYRHLLGGAKMFLESGGLNFDDIESVEDYMFNGSEAKKFIAQITKLLEIDQFEQGKQERFMAASQKLHFQLNQSDHLFGQDASVLFSAYLERRFWNAFYRTLYDAEFEDYGIVTSDREYLDKNPPPWDVLNRIFEENGIDFEYEALRLDQFTPGKTVPAWLRKRSTGATIGFSKLSSGEQMIIGLLIKVFLLEFYSGDIVKPELLLLDEPDAQLHPELTAILIRVLNSEFVPRMRVVMTTHSPTTVALAPEGAIFELTAVPNMELKAVNKDQALGILTGFLPTLSIDYNNHRQVFVESPNDRDYYQSLYEIHQRQPGIELTHKLYFIASAAGKGNCQQVKDVVRSLREAGNKTALGIIDWDKKYTSFAGNDKFTAVHGEEKRYSIESYLFDPILLIAFFVSRRYGKLINDLSLQKYPEQRIGEEPDSRLQEFADYFFECLKAKVPLFSTLGRMVEIEYQNGRRVKVPEKYLHAEGHNGLAGYLGKAFPEINVAWNSTETKDELISLIVKCYPLVPKDSISLITELANSRL